MLKERIIHFFRKPTTPVLFWFGAAVIIAIIQFLQDRYNNYLIFKGVFYHTWLQRPLYEAYPSEYWDTNHYGPFFSIMIAPFAILPDAIGMVLWSVFNTWLLYKAIKLLPLSQRQHIAILWICFVELTTSQHSLQTNPAIAAWVLLTYIFISKRKEGWAALFILLGFFVKIYGIAALALGSFAKNKWKLILFIFIWCIVLFGLPILLSSTDFLLQSYVDWKNSLTEKNLQNTGFIEGGDMQNMSVMGMISRGFGIPDLSVLSVLIPAAILMLAPLLRFSQYGFQRFQLYYVAAILLSIVLFSTGSESPTYIIAVVGAALFFVLQPRPFSTWILCLLIFMLLITCLSPTDIFPKYIRVNFIRPYSLKALPCFLIWLVVIYQLLTKKSFELEVQQ
jgi:hypothetical protein